MTPDKTRDKFNYVGDATNLTHANLLFLVHKIICNDSDELISQAAVAAIHVDPKNESIDDSLINPIANFINKFDQDKISIALCPGRLEKIDGVDQITGDTHWTGLHLRRITRDDGFISFKAYYMDSLWDKDNANFNSFYKVPEPVIRVLESFKGIGGVDFEVVKVKCNRQIDGYSCGYHAVHNLQAMHNLEIKGDGVIDLTKSTNVDQFIKEERVFLKTKFNGDLDTKLMEARTKRGEGEKQGEKSKEEYESEVFKIAFSDSYNNLDKLKRIIQIEDEVNKIKDATNRDMISSFLEFEKYYELFLRNFALDLQNKCSLKKELISEDEVVLNKRDNFFIKLTSDEVTKNPRKFLDILSTIDKNPISIDTIGEIETDEDLKVKINENKKLLLAEINREKSYFNKDFINNAGLAFGDRNILTFKKAIISLSKIIDDYKCPDRNVKKDNEIKRIKKILLIGDGAKYLTAITPDYYQPKPRGIFKGWGLEAVFKGTDLTIKGKKVEQIFDNEGRDILAELKEEKFVKDNPELFAYAVTYFFRKEGGDINIVYADKSNEILSKNNKKNWRIDEEGNPQEVKEEIKFLGVFDIDTEEYFKKRLEVYCNSPTKTPEVIPPKKDDKTPASPPAPSPAPQPLKLPRDRQYNLNLGANNIKRYGFLGEPDSGNESGKVNANKFIIVDPAGTAFKGIAVPLNQTGATAGSGALYAIFKERPTMLKGITKEGVKVNAKNEIITIEAGYAVYNNLSTPNKDFYGIIHAVGPDNQGEKQQGFLTQCLKNVFIEYDNEAKRVKEENRPGLRIPAISGNLYRNIIGHNNDVNPPRAIYQSDNDYNEMFRKALEEGYNEACIQLKKEIKFGQGLEICMYSQKMYNSMLDEITKVPNPAISPVDVKAMEPKVNGRDGG